MLGWTRIDQVHRAEVIAFQSNTSSAPQWLQAHEEIVWVGQTQYGSRGWGGGMVLVLFGGFFLAVGVFATALIMAAFGLLFMIIGIPLTYQGIIQGGIRFYLTSFRLVRVKKGSIVAQISREIFRGKSLSSFLRVTKAPRRDERGRSSQPVENFHVEVLDPNSGNHLMSLGWLPEPSVKALETISQDVYCQYCGRKNLASSAVCSECGANL